jgi:cell surface protein SprA
MNFSDYQMIENRTSGFTVGLGYKVKGLTLNWLKFKGKRTILHNDLNLRFDISIRDQVTVNHLIDQGQSRPTAGSRIIAANPSIDYVINKQLNIRIFLNRQKTLPKTFASFPSTTTQAGITLRFNLSNF